jgi:FtsZ-interacting cell division protein YlmF
MVYVPRSLCNLAIMLTLSSCVAANNAGQLVAVTSGYVNSLSKALQSYATTAQQVQQEDATRVVQAQARATSDNTANQAAITAWKVANQNKKVTAFQALQTQADNEMMNVANSMKETADSGGALQSTMTKVAYDPQKFTDTISALQQVQDNKAIEERIKASIAFSSTTLNDLQMGLSNSKQKISATSAMSSAATTQN